MRANDNTVRTTPTPAPWRIEVNCNGQRNIIMSGAEHVACTNYTAFHSQEECDANAVLIAAAPDLLLALEALLVYAADTTPEGLDGCLEVWAQAQAAVARAKNRETIGLPRIPPPR